MNFRLNKLLIAALLILATSTASAEIGVSIQLQNDQILSDAKTGMVSAADARTLMENLDRIKFEYKRAKSDGVINHYETLTLNRMLAENEQAILRYRQNRKKK